MSNIRTLQRSFAGGEVSPEMYGRIDDSKYQTGLAIARNFIIKPQGPAENRPGFAFVREVKDSTKKVRLLPFTYSTTQTMILELGDGYIRFHTQGATLLQGSPTAYDVATAYEIGDICASSGVNYYCIFPTTNNAPPNTAYWYAEPTSGEYEIPTPYAEADLFDLHYVQSADVLTITHTNYPVMELRRLGATDWVLAEVVMAPTLPPPVATITSSSSTSYSYVVTANILTALALGQFPITAETYPSAASGCYNDLSIAGAHNTITWDAKTSAVSYNVYRQVGTTYYLIGHAQGYSFTDDSSITIGTQTPPTTSSVGAGPTTVTATAVSPTASSLSATATTNGATNLTTQRYVITAVNDNQNVESIATPEASCSNNLAAAGTYNTLHWPSVSGATHYNVYKFLGGIFGYIGQAKELTFIDDNIAPDMSKTPPVYTEPFIGTGNYPGAVSYFEQRRVFAGTINAPQNIWMTKSGTESSMGYSLPIRDDDRIAFRVAAREANTIRHIVPLSGLILLTGSAEWRVTSVNSDAITPNTISVRPQSYIGASNVQPMIINTSLIYGAARGGHVREMAYSWQANGFMTGDLSLRATHLFDNLEILDMAYSKAPQPVVWFISSNGKLLGLTYVPDQQVGAWHQHDTDGTFESCATVAEFTEDYLYVVVQRTINGMTKRYIERMESRQFATQSDAFFVDCGGTYSGSTTTTINNLTWLEGKTVNVLTDGAVHPQCVVTNGTITLQQPASTVQIGLPIAADLQTLPIAAQIDNGFGQGRLKNVNKAWLRVYNSSGILVGPDTANLKAPKLRTTEPYGSPPAFKSQEVEIVLTPTWGDGGQIYVRQADPLPLTIVSMTLEIDIGA